MAFHPKNVHLIPIDVVEDPSVQGHQQRVLDGEALSTASSCSSRNTDLSTGASSDTTATTATTMTASPTHHPGSQQQKLRHSFRQQTDPTVLLQKFARAAERVRGAGAAIISDQALQVNRELLLLAQQKRTAAPCQPCHEQEISSSSSSSKRRRPCYHHQGGDSAAAAKQDPNDEDSSIASLQDERPSTTESTCSSDGGVDRANNKRRRTASNGEDASNTKRDPTQHQHPSSPLSLYEKAARTKRVADLMRQVEDLHRKLFLELADVVQKP